MTSSFLGRGWSRRSIQYRVVLLVATGVLAAFAVLGGTTWIGVERMSARLSGERLLLARSVAQHLDHLVQADMEALQGVSAAPTLNLAAPGDVSWQPVVQDAYLRLRLADAILLVARDGSIRMREPAAGAGGTAVVPPDDVAEALQSGRPSVSSLEGPRARLFLLVPIRDWRGEVTAVAAGEIDPAGPRLASALQPFRFAGLASIDVVDDRGRVVASTDGARRGGQHGTAEIASAVQRRQPVVARGTGDEAGVVFALAPLAAARWGVVIRQDASAFAQASDLRRVLSWLAPLLLGLALLFAWGAARSVRGPLAVLTESAERIAYGNLTKPIPDLGADEVGRLGRSLEQMRMALKASLDHVERANEDLERRVEERTGELHRLYDQLREREQWREELLRKVISAQEDERRRLARELHDETSQTLSALAMKIETALAAWPAEPSRDRLQEARQLTVRTIEELHRLIFDLRPSVLDDLGLLSAIRWYAERHLEPKGIAVRCEFAGFGSRLLPELETALFRVAQEAITNIAKHSGADTVLIQCLERDGQISIEIEDDGKGFSPESLPPPAARERGLGLLGMRERVELFGGTLELDSAPGSGTRIAVSVPVVQEVTR